MLKNIVQKKKWKLFIAMVEEVEAGQHVVFTQLMSWWAKQNLQLRSVDKVEHKDWTVSDVIITTYHDSQKKVIAAFEKSPASRAHLPGFSNNARTGEGTCF